MLDNPTTPMKGAKGRSTGSHKVPEGVKPSGPTGGIPDYPTKIQPGQRVKARPNKGSHTSNTQPNRQVDTMRAKGNPGGAGSPAGSTKSPFRRKGGSDKSKI